MAESSHPFQDTDEILEERTLPNVNAKSNVGNFVMLLIAEINKGWEQSGGKIIDAEIPCVLKRFEGVGFTRAGQPTDNDQVQAGHEIVTTSVAYLRYFSLRAAVSLLPIQRGGTRWAHERAHFAGSLGHIGYAKEGGNEISREIHVGTRSRSLSLGRLMIDKAFFPFPKLCIHTVDEGVDCGIHLRCRCLGLYSFAADRSRDFGLML